MKHRIVIVGGGAGGLELATRLGKTVGKRGKAQVTLVDANMTHIWKPLLHEVAAGSFNSFTDELNYLAQAKWNNFDFQLGHMDGLDRVQKTISLAASRNEHGAEQVPTRLLPYDTLVIAVGSTTNDFGTSGAAEHCLFLDTRAQAERFHRCLLSHYLRAHASEGQQSTIDIAIVGAGATGVELAAELHHTAREFVAYGLNGIKPDNIKVTLVEAGPRVLPALPERVSQPVHQTLSNLGVNVITGAAVSKVTPDGLYTEGGDFIPASMKVWAAGIKAPAFLRELEGLETNRINQLLVHPTLQTTRDESIFAIGDCAACFQPDSNANVPPRAQAAHQQASLLAKSIALRLRGEPALHYRYQDYGSLISLSRFSAVGNLMGNLTGNIMLEGWLARMFYKSLYRMHQVTLYGFTRAALMIIADRINASTTPRLKLH
ncbi:NAD(P)/FAD-dependent oxidoreductase [Pseudomonas brenneri]|uniref:NAD(P)/FAD-dependent oxidoreductase n=1 Tax=Pseudomonas brenneri TaxID=129817 RepID=UPI003BA2068B